LPGAADTIEGTLYDQDTGGASLTVAMGNVASYLPVRSDPVIEGLA
jgi:hypothetical protein